jgi:ribonuclease R
VPVFFITFGGPQGPWELPGNRYTYNENTRRIIGDRSRREFAIEDQIEVILDRVEPMERKLQFSIFEPEPERRRRKYK